MMKLEDVLQIPLAPLTAQQIREHVVEMNSTLLRNIENGQWKLLYMVCQGNANYIMSEDNISYTDLDDDGEQTEDSEEYRPLYASVFYKKLDGSTLDTGFNLKLTDDLLKILRPLYTPKIETFVRRV